MATKIDDLTAASALDGTEGLHVVQGGNSRLSSAADIVGLGAVVLIAQSIAAADTSVDFTQFDAAKYDSYIFKFGNVLPSNDGDALSVRTSSDGGATYDAGTGYARAVFLQFDGGSTSHNSNPSGSAMSLDGGVGNAAGEEGVSGTMYLHSPELAKRTHATFLTSGMNASGTSFVATGSGVRKSSADVDAIRFYFGGGNITSGTITMYGVRK